ncbi:MAG: rod shape-determining protein MreC [Moraxellaceae bacterium]|nr:rod shape-determining protein MreC [Moraxellaceae bacterium]
MGRATIAQVRDDLRDETIKRRAIIETTLFSKTSNGGYSLLFAALLSAGLMFADLRFGKEITEPVRFRLNGLLTPVYGMMSWPGRLAEVMSDATLGEEELRSENAYLRSQLLVLSGRVQKLSELAAENARLRGLLDSTLVVDGRVLIAEIIGVDPDPFRQVILLNKGADAGAYLGQPVLDARGVMGQIVEVGPETSRALLIADREHGVPVRVARNGIRAIAAGTGEIDRLRLLYVPESADVKVGDLLLTSGLGLRYPAGYPVGVVSKVGKTGTSEFAEIEARPSAELDRSRHVLLLFNRPLRAEQSARRTTP